MSVEKIYEHLVAAATPLKLPSPWQSLCVDPAFLQLIGPVETLREDLLAKFELPVLFESGVFMPTKDGAAVANPQVFTPNAVIWALRIAPKAAPFQLIADQRSVRRTEWSLFSILRAYETEALIEDMPDRVAVAFSMIDLAILWTLRIPAVPAVGLQRLNEKRFDVFRRLMRLQNQTTQRPSMSPGGGDQALTGSSRSLVLHDWSLERLGLYEGSQGRELWSYLGKLDKYLHLNLRDCEYVRPTVDELAKLQFIVEHGRWNELRDTIVDGPYAEARSLFSESLERHAPLSLAAAMERWNSALRHQLDAGGKHAAWQDVLNAQEREILRPLAVDAQRTDDSAERNLLTALEGMSRLLHPQSLLLAEKLGQASGAKGAASVVASNKEEFQQMFATADRVLALSSGVQACRKNKRLPKINLPERKRQNSCANGSASGPSTSQP